MSPLRFAVLVAFFVLLGSVSCQEPHEDPSPVPQPSPNPIASVSTPEASAVSPSVVPSARPSNDDDVPDGLDPETWKWIKMGLFSFQIIVGLAWCFAGYRLFKPALFAAGFVLFFFICIQILLAHTTLAVWITICIAAGTGVVGGVMMVLVFKAGVFVMGFIAGSLLAIMAVAFTPLSALIQNNISSDLTFWVFLACVVGAGVLVGVASIFLIKHILIFTSAINGAILIGIAVDRIADQKIFDVLSALFSKQIPHDPISWDVQTGWPMWLMLGGIVIFAVAGVVIQYKFTSRNFTHEDKPKGSSEEEFPLLIQTM